MEEKTETIEGTLVGADITSKRFHFIADKATTSIRGRFADAISESHKAQLPARYTATIKRTIQATLATEEERVWHFLVDLAEPKQKEEEVPPDEETPPPQKPEG
jgi:hypothetical protein